MIKIDLVLPYRYDTAVIKERITSTIPILPSEISDVNIVRRELTISSGEPSYKATVAFSALADKEEGLLKIRNKVSRHVGDVFIPPKTELSFRPIVVGAGPAGLFAALTLAEAGTCPIVLERGLPVEERIKKIELFNKLGILDTECNAQFGEGGAGTYSDGKLKVGARDKYKMKVLSEFITAGADESIAYSASAHLGTDKLPEIIKRLREKITFLGAEFVFSAKLVDIKLKNDSVYAVVYEKNGEFEEIPTEAVILATGHSARDTVAMLREKGLPMSAKGFGIGMRIEHPRDYINRIVYKDAYGKVDETASYHLVTHLANGRSVYSFCMCPGGTVVAATNENGGIVTNGMSEYARMSDNSNAAILVSVIPDDFGTDDPLGGIELQRKIERAAFDISSSFKAPSISLHELMKGGVSKTDTDVVPSYPLGTVSAHPDEYMPKYISESVRVAIIDFDSWLPGYAYGGAVFTGPETRTTSAVRLERTDEGESVNFSGIYPTGEGAGYAGGIVSSATDGIRMAEKILLKFANM